MKNNLLFFAVVVLLSACTLANEKEAAEATAKDLGVTEFTVTDTTIFENKAEHPTLVLYFKEPKMESPELDPVYLSSKTAYNYVNKLGLDKATAYHNIIVKLGIKGYVYSNSYSIKTLNNIDRYYAKAKDFIINVTNTDSAAIMAALKPGVINHDDMVQVYIMDDDQKMNNGNLTDIKMVGFEETHTEITGRDVMAVRAVVYRQNKASEVYNFTFDRADQKIVGIGWDILKQANEANTPGE
jgi:hypothetical protein